jgi:hypothetical protein
VLRGTSDREYKLEKLKEAGCSHAETISCMQVGFPPEASATATTPRLLCSNEHGRPQGTCPFAGERVEREKKARRTGARL